MAQQMLRPANSFGVHRYWRRARRATARLRAFARVSELVACPIGTGRTGSHTGRRLCRWLQGRRCRGGEGSGRRSCRILHLRNAHISRIPRPEARRRAWSTIPAKSASPIDDAEGAPRARRDASRSIHDSVWSPRTGVGEKEAPCPGFRPSAVAIAARGGYRLVVAMGSLRLIQPEDVRCCRDRYSAAK